MADYLPLLAARADVTAACRSGIPIVRARIRDRALAVFQHHRPGEVFLGKLRQIVAQIFIDIVAGEASAPLALLAKPWRLHI
jgi:hypothetical protein